MSKLPSRRCAYILVLHPLEIHVHSNIHLHIAGCIQMHASASPGIVRALMNTRGLFGAERLRVVTMRAPCTAELTCHPCQ